MHVRSAGDLDWSVLICLLGGFRLLKAGQEVELRIGGKSQALLSNLALRAQYGYPREVLLAALWPEADASLAGESLNSLVYRLHRLLGDALDGRAPVVYANECYWLNTNAGVGVDVAVYDALVRIGNEHVRAGDRAAAVDTYGRAIRLYHGDLCSDGDVYAVMESERLRNQHSALLAYLAEQHFADGDYAACLERAFALLAHDPCREDVHRLVMRCYVRRGERARALRQYRLCESILRSEVDAVPERATLALFEQVRLTPDNV